jgi:GNAT superfamily N-acetyltransferase
MALSYRLAQPSDNPRIQDLVAKITMPGPAEMCFQRQPDFFTGAQVIGESYTIVVVDDDERPEALAGLTVISGRHVFINGEKRYVYYSGDTRVDPHYRRRGIAGALFVEQKKHHQPSDLVQGVIIKGNTRALEAGRRVADHKIFDFWLSHTIETSFMFIRKGAPRVPAGVTLRAATAADVPAIQAFQDREGPRRNGYPAYDFSRLMAGDPYYAGLSIGDYTLALRDGQIVGMLAAWNQKAYKQTRIMGFHPAARVLRPLYNLYVGVVGGFKLPPVGGVLNYLTLANVLIAKDEPAIYQALIDWVMAHQGKKVDALATCVTHGDPLVEVPRGYKRQKLFSEHLWLTFGDEDPRPGIDQRPLYMELGRL